MTWCRSWRKPESRSSLRAWIFRIPPKLATCLPACNAVVSGGDDVSLFRVAALPCFHVQPEDLRQVMRANAREKREDHVVPLSRVLDGVAGGADVIAAVKRTRDEIRRREAKARAALDIIVKQFALEPPRRFCRPPCSFVDEWEKKKVNKTD